MWMLLSREERYQIYSLLKVKQTIREIARLLGRNRSITSRELGRVRGKSGYCADQASAKASDPAWCSCNAHRVEQRVWADMTFYLGFNGAQSRMQARWLSVMSVSVYITTGARSLEATCTRTCDAWNPDANGICKNVTGADRFATVSRSASDQTRWGSQTSGALRRW